MTKKRKSRKKKSYNPLKMWGSYAGTVLGFLVGFWLSPDCDASFGQIGISGCDIPAIITYVIGGIILGFLLGYTIHSLIRKLRK